ncbi:hypothetical protein V5N11_030354 [Cardamine amara subsp. amara]|uniref:Uncharacterized protein n=1 Tax=Cardamine amara subsp. amara TaxID=228776 RepID=A0ABD1BFY7_CARAN
MELPKNTNFYWACIQEFREDKFWRKYFVERADNTFEDKIQFLKALTGFTRDDERVGKRLSSGKYFGSPGSSIFHSGSPSSGGNTCGQWGHPFQQWDTPPSAQQWGTPPSAQQCGTPPSAQQWGTPPSTQQ